MKQDKSQLVPVPQSPEEQPKAPVKFNVTSLEFTISLALAIVLWLYQLGVIGFKTQEINNSEHLRGVSISWLGYPFDNSDPQWREFRENLPIFLSVGFVFLVLSKIIKILTQGDENSQRRFTMLRNFYIIFGLPFIFFLFSYSAFLWLAYTLANYILLKLIGRYSFFPIILWTISIMCLYQTNQMPHFPYGVISRISPELGTLLWEDYRNSMVPWNSIYHMTLLRVMAFCFDKIWATRQQFQFNFARHCIRCTTCQENKPCYKNVSETYLQSQYYESVLNYYSYLLYVPLFITGPQITFNAFITQLKQNQKEYSNKVVNFYALRAINNIIVTEIFTHFTFARALSQLNFHLITNFTAQQAFMLGVSNLIFIWVKFLTIWRLARAIALLDGINCPENMNRCILNNYSFEGFWRSWHRGFNQWLIRYIFIPLGGSKHKIWNIWVVFTFVAIWHDFELNLVLWAWLICLTLMPEMMVKTYFNSQRKAYLWKSGQFKVISNINSMYIQYIAALFAILVILSMISANLIGFGFGWDPMVQILKKFSESEEPLYQIFLTALPYYPLVIVMYWIRDSEDDLGY